MLKWTPAQSTATIGSQHQRRRRFRVLLRREQALLEGENLIGPLDGGDMSEKRPDGVARRIVKMIELRGGEPFDRCEGGRACVAQHANESPDCRRIATDRLDPQRGWRDHEPLSHSAEPKVPHAAR